MGNETNLASTADNLLKSIYQVKEGEVFVITADEYNDPAVINAIADAAKRAGCKVLTIWMPAPAGVGMAADAGIAGQSLIGVMAGADCWAEFNKVWIFGGQTYIDIMKTNPKLRHMCLTGASADLINNCIGKINYEKLIAFGNRFAELIAASKSMRMMSKKGMDLSFVNDPERPILKEFGDASTPGSHMLPGQIAWTPAQETINGTIVFDAALAPVCGIPSAPVVVEIKNGTAQSFTGGPEAAEYENWLKSYNEPQMFNISHSGLGINPGAVLSGDILADQRVWGSGTWAFGSIGANLVPPKGVPAPSHSDCVCLNITLYVDDRIIFEDGVLVDEELKALADGLGG